jgi:hypothetical protein
MTCGYRAFQIKEAVLPGVLGRLLDAVKGEESLASNLPTCQIMQNAGSIT